MGGQENFPKLSPSIILSSSSVLSKAGKEIQTLSAMHQSSQKQSEVSFHLEGDAIPFRISGSACPEHAACQDHAALQIPLKRLEALPPVYVMSSCADHMV
jgi:hypothetical protein